MKSGGRLFLIAAVWLIEVVLTVLLVQAPWIERFAAAERAQTQAFCGLSCEEAILARSDAIFHRWFVDTGMVAGSYAEVLPAPRAGDIGIAPWFFSWLKTRLDALWGLVYETLFRLELIAQWVGVLTLFAAAALIDGATTRQIARVNQRYASADRYAIAKRILLLALAALLLYLPLPVSVDPRAVPLWGAVVILALRLLVGNAQHEL